MMIDLPVLGTPFQGIAAFSSTGVLIAVSSIWLKSRKLAIAENQADREGYGDVIRVLREELDRLATSHDRCAERVSATEKELVIERTARLKLEDELHGVQRQLIGFQVASARALPPESVSKDISDMVERIDEIQAKRNGDK